MQLTGREIWALVHGMLIGGPFLLAFTGALVSLAGLRSEYLTADLVVYYGRSLARDRTARNLVLTLMLGAFAVASLAALIGSLVTRAAPIR